MNPAREGTEASPSPRHEILAILEGLLENPVDPSQQFIALGGDSVRAMQAAARIKRRLQLDLQPELLLKAASVSEAIAGAEAERTGETVDADEVRPGSASRGQQQLWFVDALGDGSGLYNISSAIHFGGRLQIERLATAIEATLVAHESLRTVFRERRSGLEREVLPVGSIALRRHSVRGLPPATAAEDFRRIGEEVSSEAFSLADGPVVRAVLVERRQDLASLILVAHHTALDAWSLGLLCDEIVTRFTADLDGQDPWDLPTEPYESFVQEEARSRSQRGRQDLRWWRDYLAGAPTELALSSARERPPWQDFSGSRRPFDLPDPSRLREVSRRSVTTPFSLLLAAFGICLHRETGQRDLLVGIPLAGRNRPELHEVVGFCAKLLPIRLVLADDDEPFTQLARRLQRSVSMVLEHGAVDLADLVRELSLSGDPSRNPLVQVVFAKHDDLVARGPVGAGLVLDFEDLDTGSSPVDLTLSVESLEPPARAAIEYATAVASEADAGRLAAAYSATLEAVLADPELPVGEAMPLSR
jgi:acyl carrier protein